MSLRQISNLSSDYLQSVLSTALQNTGGTLNKKTNNLDAVASASQPDRSQLSPFAQMMSKLQQLQQSDPAKYQQVTEQIATNLQTAAQTAQSNGDSSAAAQLNKLASDFSATSTSSQLPNIQDLAQAVGGHHHHHHSHHASADADAVPSTSSNPSPASNASAGAASTGQLSQFLSSLQASRAQNDASNPMTIIADTLSRAGL